MSIRALINLRIIASVILILIFSAIIAIWQARSSVENEVDSSINLAVQMIEFGFTQLPSVSKENDAWLEQLATMQPVRHLNISIEDNKTTLQSNKPLYIYDEKSDTPNWFMKAVMLDSIIHSYDIKITDGSTKTIFITANPMDEISEA